MSPFGVKYGIAAGAETIVGIDRHPQPDLQLHDKLWRIESKAQYLRRDRRQETAGASQALGIEIRLLRHCAGGKLTPKVRFIDLLGNRFLAQNRKEFRRQLLVDVQGGVDSTKDAPRARMGAESRAWTSHVECRSISWQRAQDEAREARYAPKE